jgi:hypothetical protein
MFIPSSRDRSHSLDDRSFTAYSLTKKKVFSNTRIQAHKVLAVYRIFTPSLLITFGSKSLTAREDHSGWLYDRLDHLDFANGFDPLSNIWNSERSASRT